MAWKWQRFKITMLPKPATLNTVKTGPTVTQRERKLLAKYGKSHPPRARDA